MFKKKAKYLLQVSKMLLGVFVTAALFLCCQSSNKPSAANEILEKASKAPGINAGSGNFSVTSPEGWEQKDTTLKGVRFLFILSPRVAGQMFRPSMNVVTEDMNHISFEEYVSKNKIMMGRYFQQYK